MSNITDLKHETTLASLAENQDGKNNKNFFAIIVDISEPTKCTEGSNFIVQLKIIDPSFNYKSKISCENLRFHKYANVRLIIEDVKDCPRIESIGSIFRGRRLNATVGEKGDLCLHEVKFSNWLIYSGKPGD